MRTALILVTAVTLGGQATQTPPVAGAIPFDSTWTLEGERTRVVRDGKRDVLQVESGFAHKRDVRLLDGTIEFDVRLTERRSFVYVHFRSINGQEREEFYLRPHKSSLPDAVQYAPVWQGRSSWQLYHGPGGTAAVPFATDRWTHVRVVIQGRSAALFVDDMKVPVLVSRLAREPQAGSISLGGFLPAGVPGSGPIATFANVQVQPGVIPAGFSTTAPTSEAAPAAPPGAVAVVRGWMVSQSFVPESSAAAPTLPAAAASFERLTPDESGLLELHRYVKVPDGSRVAAAVARVNVTSTSAQTVAFDLGFSDIATVFVNGVATFTGDASYSFDRPRREGLIGFDQARLYLPLRAGENDISVVLSDSFGGWGLMGRFVNPSGLKIH